MAKLNALALPSPGSRPLRNAKREKFARLRASAQPRIPAYREAGFETGDDDDAYSNSCRLERRPEIRDRIAYLTRQAEEMISVKRERIESQLWAITEGNIAYFFETYEAVKRDHTGQPVPTDEGGLSKETRVRPKLLTDLPRELAALIEDVQVDNRGQANPQALFEGARQ